MTLFQFIKRLYHNSFIRYLFVGGINTCFGYLMFALWVFLLKNVYLATVVATVINVLFNFNTYSRIVFKSNDHSRVYRFFGVYLFAMSLQLILLRTFAHFGLTNPYLAGGILVLPMAALSFILMRKFVFRAC